MSLMERPLGNIIGMPRPFDGLDFGGFAIWEYRPHLLRGPDGQTLRFMVGLQQKIMLGVTRGIQYERGIGVIKPTNLPWAMNLNTLMPKLATSIITGVVGVVETGGPDSFDWYLRETESDRISGFSMRWSSEEARYHQCVRFVPTKNEITLAKGASW